MLKLKAILKEAIARASEDERDLATKLAQTVLEQRDDQVVRMPSLADEITKQELALLAKQRTVDLLKSALARLPEAADTY